MRKCAICKEVVLPGKGSYYGGRLVHKSCRGIAKIQRYRLNR